MKTKLWMVGILLGFAGVATGRAQEEAVEATEASEPFRLEDHVSFVDGPGKGDMGERATLTFPAGYRFAGPKGAQTMMELTGNLVGGNEIGFVMPDELAEGEDSWFIVFEYSEVGYVSDSDKADLDAAKMFKQMKSNEKNANRVRAERGMSTLEMQGWAVEPFYNEQTHNLEWATELLVKPEGAKVVNHNIRLLGRNGYVEATVVCGPEQLASVRPRAQAVLAGFEYVTGERYAEFRQGDKMAQYGLTGLVVGGAVAAAAHTGLLQKILKPLIIGVIAIGAFFKRIFTGKKS
jgi:uncharacterized membrane-anchored protein